MHSTISIRRVSILAALVAAGLAAPLHAQWAPATPAAEPGGSDFPYCQIADRMVDPMWSLTLSYVSREPVDGVGTDVGFFDEQARASFYYLRTPYGNLDLGATLDHRFVIGGDELDLPSGLARIAADARWDLRTVEAFTFRVEGHPGYYGATDHIGAHGLTLPFAISGIQAFDPTVSAQLGVAVFPGFQREFDPILGVRWAVTDDVLLDLFYPVTRVLYKPAVDWQVFGGLGIYRTREYFLADDDPRERVLCDESRLFVGFDFLPDESLRLGLRAGYAFNRSIDFARGAPNEFDLDAGWFAAFELGGSF